MNPSQLGLDTKKTLICQNPRLFNDRVLATEAFRWDLQQMLHFLDEAAKNPSHYGVHKDHHHTLVTAVERLEHLSDLETSRAFTKTENALIVLDPVDINWEGISLKCHSQYDLLGLVLSILGRAPSRATRRNHHLPLLILCVRFMILAAGEKPKDNAPHLVSIISTDDDEGDFKVQVSCSPPESLELEGMMSGLDLDAVTDSPDLNVVMGATILQGRRDFPTKLKSELRRLIRLARYHSLEKQGGYVLPGNDVTQQGCKYCGACGETLSLVLLRRNTTFKGRKVGGLSLKLSAVLELKEIDDLTLEGLMDPCDTCQDMLKQAGVDVERFRICLVDTAWIENLFENELERSHSQESLRKAGV